MDVNEAAVRLRVHPTSVRRYIRSGRLRATPLATPQGTRYQISEESLRNFLQGQQQDLESPSPPVAAEAVLHELGELRRALTLHARTTERDSDEMWQALEAVSRKVDELCRVMTGAQEALATLSDSRLKARDEQLVYAMRSRTQDRKRWSIFGKS